jgi:hypothetical protein
VIYPRCGSWYLGADVPGKPRVFMPLIGFPPYVDKCNDIAFNGYAGFVTTPGPVAQMGDAVSHARRASG